MGRPAARQRSGLRLVLGRGVGRLILLLPAPQEFRPVLDFPELLVEERPAHGLGHAFDGQFFLFCAVGGESGKMRYLVGGQVDRIAELDRLEFDHGGRSAPHASGEIERIDRRRPYLGVKRRRSLPPYPIDGVTDYTTLLNEEPAPDRGVELAPHRIETMNVPLRLNRRVIGAGRERSGGSAQHHKFPSHRPLSLESRPQDCANASPPQGRSFGAGRSETAIRYVTESQSPKRKGGDMTAQSAEWWRGGVIYQIYPRSFADSNGDGVGDLDGVRSKLGYISKLGVDGVWLSPFFKSPMRDFGYDVSDYRDVDPVFGALADFEKLLEEAHGTSLRLVIDQVYSHTSDQHAWFKESRSSSANPKADWYVWADAKPDGGPPNNWISLFGGQAWSWDSRRRQYYMHNFLAEQPDLNFHNPEVRAAILDIARFWLDKGVDGFRLDVANFYYCDRTLRSNPPKRAEGGFARPYQFQQHLYDKSQPENVAFMEELRRLFDQYSDRMTVAEIGDDAYVERSMEYSMPGRLHTAYNFFLLENGPLTARLIRNALESWTSEDAWPSWSFSNHDVVRARTRWGGANASDAFAQLLNGVLMCLKGTIFLYQGEELGLPQAHVPFEKLKDPEGIRFWPDSLGRDGCRTPIPWTSEAPQAGFSLAEPWLPVDPAHYAFAVDRQDGDSASTLSLTRGFIAMRRRRPALRLGSIEFLDATEPLLVFRRRYQDESLLCVFNLGDQPAALDLPEGGRLLAYGLPAALSGGRLSLPAFGGAIVGE